MRKVQLLILLAFVALFGAGVVSALVAERYVIRRDPPPRPGFGGGMMAQELGLSKEQHEGLAKIWSDVREETRKNWDTRRESQQQRDKEIEAMLTPEQRTQLKSIAAAHDARQAKVREQNEELTKAAEQKTRDLLTDAQKVKFDEFLKRNKERGDRGERGGPPGRGPSSRPFGGPPGGLGGGMGGGRGEHP